MRLSRLVASVTGLLLFGSFMSIKADTFSLEDHEDFSGYYGVTGLVIDAEYNGYANSSLWSGYYLGTFDGNDDQSELQSLASYYLGDSFVSTAYAKVDSPSGGTSGFLTVTVSNVNEDGEALGGIWSADSPYSLGFYAVKASDQFALYYVDPSQTIGIWSTANIYVGQGRKIHNPGLSHLSGMPSAPVPEPTTITLLGIGLIGLAGLSIRKSRKQ